MNGSDTVLKFPQTPSSNSASSELWPEGYPEGLRALGEDAMDLGADVEPEAAEPDIQVPASLRLHLSHYHHEAEGPDCDISLYVDERGECAIMGADNFALDDDAWALLDLVRAHSRRAGHVAFAHMLRAHAEIDAALTELGVAAMALGANPAGPTSWVERRRFAQASAAVRLAILEALKVEASLPGPALTEVTPAMIQRGAAALAEVGNDWFFEPETMQRFAEACLRGALAEERS